MAGTRTYGPALRALAKALCVLITKGRHTFQLAMDARMVSAEKQAKVNAWLDAAGGACDVLNEFWNAGES